MTVPTRRNRHEALSPPIRSLNDLNYIMARIEANLAGYTGSAEAQPGGLRGEPFTRFDIQSTMVF